MKTSYRRLMSLIILGVLIASASFAQQGQGSDQFSQMREKYKYTFQLMGMVRHIEAINSDPKYALTPDQSKKVLAVLKPLRSKPKMTQDQAKAALISLKPIFTLNQLNAMARIKDERPGQGGPGGSGRPGGPGGFAGRPGGPNGPQGQRPRFDPNAMKDFNPFYTKPGAKDGFTAMHAKHWNDFFGSLEKKANQSKPAKAQKAKPAVKPAKKVVTTKKR